MTKENRPSITDRINHYQQEAENQRQADIVTRQQQQNQEKEKQRQEEIKRQEETQEMIRRTKENFAGTGIVEAFQEIIDKEIIRWNRRTFERNHKKYGALVKKPIDICYMIEGVSLEFNERHETSGGDADSGYGSISYTENDFIMVKKINESTFELTSHIKDQYKSSGPLFGNSEETIDNIAKIVSKPIFIGRI